MYNEDLLKKIEVILSAIKLLNNERLDILGEFLLQRIANPDNYVVFLGETSSGKSTIINSFIKKKILPVSSIPTTGAITEIYFDNECEKIKYYAINQDATMEMIDSETFKVLAQKPDQNLSRLRVVVPTDSNDYNGMRLFDTPGYGSIINEHEEVLRDFIPNADIIVYAISYKAGFQQYDYEFMCSLSSMFDKNMPFVLAINRCPDNVTLQDRRIKEIKEYVTSILQKPNLPVFILPSAQFQELVEVPVIQKFKNEILGIVNAPERDAALECTFKKYIYDYIKLIELEIDKYSRTAEEVENIKKANEELCRDFDNVIPDVIEPGFIEISTKLPVFVNKCAERIENQLIKEIEGSDTLKMEEMKAYIQIHKLPYLNQQESKELQNNLKVLLLDLDQEVHNYLKTAILHYESRITVRTNDNTIEETGKRIAKGKITELASNSLLEYFSGLGGAGKAGAGIANAASHGLKQVGDLFGHTFSKETHNQLKKFLSKIGATSSKIVGPAVAVFFEVIDIGYDYFTWKGKLKDKIKEAVNKWRLEAKEVLLKDLNELKEENIKKIQEIKECMKTDAIDVPKGDFSMEQLITLQQYLEKVKKEMV